MAHFGRTLIRGGSQRGTDATSGSGGKSAGQRLDSSDERSCRRRIALTFSTTGVFPMTHHVECVALLEKPALTCGGALRDKAGDLRQPALCTLGALESRSGAAIYRRNERRRQVRWSAVTAVIKPRRPNVAEPGGSAKRFWPSSITTVDQAVCGGKRAATASTAR